MFTTIRHFCELLEMQQIRNKNLTSLLIQQSPRRGGNYEDLEERLTLLSESIAFSQQPP